ncbi:MAG TPA: hypothetical protein VGN60_09500 [Devosia sp.]|jgi:hypothetical protein|nr:hypothetical protein [Devosia sp.]
MAWFRNHYRCGDCGTAWGDEWSCCCDDECPGCGSSDWSPYDSDDLTFITEVDENDSKVTIFESPPSAEHKPAYRVVAVALSSDAAKAYIKQRMATYRDATP